MKLKRGMAADIALMSLMTALIVVASWISIPFGIVPVTFQTFVIYVASALLGAKKAAVSVFVYLLLGVAGLPVFSGFRGGIGALFGATGGYVFGFVFVALIAGLIIGHFGKKIHVMCIAFFSGTLACYFVGTLWYVFVYMKGTGAAGVIASCVLPFVVPDMLKTVAAAFVSKAVAERSLK